MDYTTPTVTDLGDLAKLTQASGIIGTEDGAGKTVQVQVGPGGSVIDLSIGLLP
ncbi:lasso RiPP family leader peptide-containing protein [Conexibacter sp. SYSU D00693]|uniref:lasso RiPP family leader peptide-containing protein n=1 Tax=Conexibacter sp. SYSU D00693 TaxID=2812560 RepID=UPI00196AA7E3|nr:lasso RiPP family leader peptide-containing protein [Conexibacter sp. SYSU D00693]